MEVLNEYVSTRGRGPLKVKKAAGERQKKRGVAEADMI